MKSSHFEPLRRLAAFWDRHSSGTPSERWSHRLYRASLSRRHLHMRPAGPRFSVSAADGTAGARQVFWDGQLAGTVRMPGGLKDSASGHCFLVGSGPSLKEVDLKLLKGHPTMGVNGAIVKFTEASLSPTYYAIYDDDFFESRFPLVREVINARSKCFFSFAGLSRICESAPELLGQTEIYLMEAINQFYGQAQLSPEQFHRWAESDAEVVLPRGPQPPDVRIGFSRNLAKGFFLSRTVMYGALQIAYHLGFRRVFILGMDLNYQGANPRFYESAAQMRPSRIDRDFEPQILPAFELVKNICQREQFEVFNLSSTSRMPEAVIPRLTLAEALALAR